MKRRFTILEVLLISLIVFVAFFYFGVNRSNLFSSKEGLLKDRFLTYNSYLDGGNYSQAYDFLSKSEKRKISRSVYESVDSVPYKRNVVLNNLMVRGDIGYVESTLTICMESGCGDEKTTRGYMKWVYESDDWYLTLESPPCVREVHYEIRPEFKRALSLIEQRINTFLSSKGVDSYDFSYFNCLDIQYADLGNSEGLFSFDENNSTLEKLTIKVDSSYKENDDLLTAFLLSHEIFHASNYLNSIVFGDKKSCVEDELSAFESQILFMQSLNKQEHNSINRRFSEGFSQLNTPLQIMWKLWTVKEDADRYCGNNGDCYNRKLDTDITNMITKNEYYRDQCGL